MSDLKLFWLTSDSVEALVGRPVKMGKGSPWNGRPGIDYPKP